MHRAPMIVRPNDPAYLEQARAEAAFFARCSYSMVSMGAAAPIWAIQGGNRRFTGDPETTWLQDLVRRGPFQTAAALGCNDAIHEDAWLRSGGSKSLDVYELSDGVIAKVQDAMSARRFGLKWRDRRVRFIRADLNFIELPEATYDVIWSAGCIHHITNLEYLFEQVSRSLRRRGIFAFNDYVGERRLHYGEERLAFINRVLERVPVELRLGRIERVARPPDDEISPFCAVRSDEILSIARSQFERVHLGMASALWPLPFMLDLTSIDRNAPELISHLIDAEAEAEKRFQPCGTYAVFRKRG